MGPLVCDSPVGAHFDFGGCIGQRVEANLRHWLLTAPRANPAMLEILRRRDAQPPPNVVDFAGEFVGKYLISAIQGRRMTDDPALDATVPGEG